jgi:LmbE family N-acetylglucosaminyl deacetylase
MPKHSAKRAKKSARILVIGAHPDDCEISCGGATVLWTSAGHVVHYVSATNGATGHYAIGGIELVRRRMAEAAAGAAVVGATSEVFDITNGELEPSLSNRRLFIRLIRTFNPDLILTHRPNDYHPDHRYCSQLVQDASYVITVPNNVPTVEALRSPPVICYLADDFSKPNPFTPDIVVDIDTAIERKIEAIHQHVSQVYEWLPWNRGLERQVPKTDKQRKQFLRKLWLPRDLRRADRFRAQLIARYGQEAGSKVQHCEAFEVCEYGAKLTDEKRALLFGM